MCYGRRVVVVLLLAVTLDGRAQSPQQGAATSVQSAEGTVAQLEERVCAAFRGKNREVLGQLLAEDFVTVNGFDRWDRDYILEADEMPHGRCERVQIEVKAYGMAARAYGFVMGSGGDQELVSDTWIERGNEWRLVFRRSEGLEVRRYVEHALQLMEQNAWKRKEVDWKALRAGTLERAAAAKNSMQSYEALRFALTGLGDHHSHLLVSPELQQLEAQYKSDKPMAGTSAAGSGDDPAARSRFVGRYEPEGHIEKGGNRTFAVVVVPKFPGVDQAEGKVYSEKLLKIIRELDGEQPAGWVVDLRGNVGGNMWPMLVGIGPVLGDSANVGGFADGSGAAATWAYHDGIAAMVMNGRENAQAGPPAGKAYRLRSAAAVAVLIDGATGSSGEAVAISFRGRERTRFFGEHTAGFSTVNQFFGLADGAILNMTVGVDVDRKGNVYMDGLAPDETVRSAAGENDAVVRAAVKWLGRQ